MKSIAISAIRRNVNALSRVVGAVLARKFEILTLHTSVQENMKPKRDNLMISARIGYN